MSVDNKILTTISENFKNKDIKESGILTGKKKFDAVFDELSKKLACIKRHFFASPFEMMLIAVKNNYENKTSDNIQNFCYYTKPDRK